MVKDPRTSGQIEKAIFKQSVPEAQSIPLKESVSQDAQQG